MRVISPQCRDGSAESAAESAVSLQMSAVLEDFATAYGQRESISRALMREKERAGEFAGVLAGVLEDNVAGTLRTACNVLAQKRHETFGEGARAADIRMQRFMLRELLAVEGLAFMARRRAARAAGERAELLPLIRQTLGRLQPVFAPGAGEMGISECYPGIRVAGPPEGIRHILLNLFIEILCQEPGAHTYSVAMRCNEAIAEVSAAVVDGATATGCDWSPHAPGVQVASGLARDLGIVLTLSPPPNFACRLEFAIVNDS